MKKSATQKRIESKGWTVKALVSGIVKANKAGLQVVGNSMSEVRFLIRFEKFYLGKGIYAQLPLSKKAA